MADLTASEVTRIGEVAMGQAGYDYVLLELYLNHTFVTNDKLYAAQIGAAKIVGILASAVMASGTISRVNAGTNGANILPGQRTFEGSAAAVVSSVTDPGDDYVNFGSDFNTASGGYVTLLIKVH